MPLAPFWLSSYSAACANVLMRFDMKRHRFSFHFINSCSNPLPWWARVLIDILVLCYYAVGVLLNFKILNFFCLLSRFFRNIGFIHLLLLRLLVEGVLLLLLLVKGLLLLRLRLLEEGGGKDVHLLLPLPQVRLELPDLPVVVGGVQQLGDLVRPGSQH